MFIGMVPTNNSLYTYLQRCGFTLVFKAISTYMDETGRTITKGNVDTDIVLWSAARLSAEFDQAVFVSGDGDFLSLYEYMDERGKLLRIMVPNRFRYSKLLNSYRERLAFVEDVPNLLHKITPAKNQTTKKTRSSGRITSLGQPGHGDAKIIANRYSHVNQKGGGR
jgi:uncharacterized LabA/DUF88 family protein